MLNIEYSFSPATIMPIAKPPTQTKRKRTRKRKRRAAFSSSSSSSSSPSSDNEQDNTTVAPVPAPKATEPSSSDSESKSSSSVDSSDDETAQRRPRGPIPVKDTEKLPSRRLSPSPPPPPAELPSFLPQKSADNSENFQMKEQEMKMKFRQFWMSSVADGFRDDLDEIRKEPNLGTSRLALLIDSLASGADVFSSSSGDEGVNEMEVILG